MQCKLFSDSEDPLNDLPCKHYIDPLHDNEAGFCKTNKIFRCIESLKTLLPTLTQSAVKSFCQCKEKFRLQYIKGVNILREELPNPVKMGSIWDSFIDAHVSKSTFHLTDLVNKYQLYSRDVAKLKALARAFRKIGFDLRSADAQTQHKITYNGVGNHVVSGYVDITYEFSITEIKFTANPAFHQKLDSNFLQQGTYLSSNPGWEYVDLLITQEPKLKTGKAKYSDESDGAYESRIYNDILSRPAFYFIGFNKLDKTYGIRFWRKEFNLDYLRQVYINVFKDMRHTIDNNLWYRNELQCYVPQKCWFFPIKRSGVISDQLYEYIDVNEAAKGMR